MGDWVEESVDSMAETSKTGFHRIDPARSVPSDNDFTEEAKSGELDKSAPVAASNGYVTLDVTNLSFLVASSASSASGDIDLATDSRAPLTKTLSRKGSQRGGERMVSDSAAAADGEKSAFLVHMSGEEEEGTLRVATTVTAAGTGGGGGHYRRFAFRRPSPWLDPRRVLVFSATLSSMGTLVLLYFTLFMGNIPAGGDNAR